MLSNDNLICSGKKKFMKHFKFQQMHQDGDFAEGTVYFQDLKWWLITENSNADLISHEII